MKHEVMNHKLQAKLGLFEADGFNLKKLVYGAFICLAKRGSFFPCKCLRPSKKRREWEIVVFPYTELQRDYRFNVKLAGSLIASPIGIKVHTVSTPKRGVAISLTNNSQHQLSTPIEQFSRLSCTISPLLVKHNDGSHKIQKIIVQLFVYRRFKKHYLFSLCTVIGLLAIQKHNR